MKKKIELNYAALVADEFDAGQVIGEHVARQIFERQDHTYTLQYATLQWRRSAKCAALKTASGTT